MVAGTFQAAGSKSSCKLKGIRPLICLKWIPKLPTVYMLGCQYSIPCSRELIVDFVVQPVLYFIPVRGACLISLDLVRSTFPSLNRADGEVAL